MASQFTANGFPLILTRQHFTQMTLRRTLLHGLTKSRDALTMGAVIKTATDHQNVAGLVHCLTHQQSGCASRLILVDTNMTQAVGIGQIGDDGDHRHIAAAAQRQCPIDGRRVMRKNNDAVAVLLRAIMLCASCSGCASATRVLCSFRRR